VITWGIALKSVSVLLPFHRYDHFLLSSVESVLSSEFVDLDLLLIDDTPGQARIASFLPLRDSRITYLDTSGGCGYGKALEIGSQNLKGDFVALMNSDDLIDPRKFSKQLQQLKDHELCITEMRKINHKGDSILPIGGSVPARLYDPAFLILGSFGANASWMSTRKWWSDWAFFDSNSALDWRIALNSFRHSKISYIPEALYTYRSHKNQVTKKKNIFEDSFLVHNLWSAHLSYYGIEPFSHDIFEVFSAPFCNSYISHFDELRRWHEEVPATFKLLNQEQKILFESLVKRRILLLLRNAKNWRAPIFNQALSSLDEGPKLIFDLLGSRLINK